MEVNIDGSENVAIGYYSGSFVTGSFNTMVGNNTSHFSGPLNNSGAIGSFSFNTASDQFRIGNSSTSSIGGYAGWTNVSDKKFKKNINENVAGLDFILKLRPVTYKLDITKIDDYLGIPESAKSEKSYKEAVVKKENLTQSGFIAQEVEDAARLVGYEFSGVDAPKNENDFYGLRYAEFVVPMVKAIQEQQDIIEELKARIEELEKK